MKEKLKSMLEPSRYIHSLYVCETAVELAKIYGVDEEKAYIAGLLHDCAKNLSKDDMYIKCEVLNIKLDEIEKTTPALIHARLGSELVASCFGVTDEEIKNAIKYHTTGRENMTMLEKIVYVADMIEPTRDFLGVEKLRRLAKVDIDNALIGSLSLCIEFNLKKKAVIHPNSFLARNYLLLEMKTHSIDK